MMNVCQLALMISLLPLSVSGLEIPDLEHYRDRVTKILDSGNTEDGSPEVRQSLDRIQGMTSSEQWKEKKEAHKPGIANALKLPKVAEGVKDKGEEVYEYPLLFVSGSMPMETLRNYARDLERHRGRMILRGAIKSLETLQPTLRFIQGVLAKDAGCQDFGCEMYSVEILIDPLLYREHRIKQVPALVIHKGTIQHCDSDNAVKVGTGAVYGDVSLDFLMSVFRKQIN